MGTLSRHRRRDHRFVAMAHLPENQWETVTLTKKRPTNRSVQGGSAGAASATAAGYSVATQKKYGSGGNQKSGAVSGAGNLAKLENDSESLSHAKLGHSFKMAMQKARLAKKL